MEVKGIADAKAFVIWQADDGDLHAFGYENEAQAQTQAKDYADGDRPHYVAVLTGVAEQQAPPVVYRKVRA